ncbi:hypothetical protein COB57_03305 [Candidatus Peregrinibacteria bacterium]|nr:MAG: hypothetical protein COB57_03305 [Candidatus Peregrinibacteria bacterium]
MDTLDKILRDSELSIKAPHDLIDNIMMKIEEKQYEKLQSLMIRRSIFFGLSTVLFFYALSILFIDFLNAETFLFIEMGLNYPSVILSTEWSYAVWESTPISSLLFTTLAFFTLYFTFILFDKSLKKSHFSLLNLLHNYAK